MDELNLFATKWWDYKPLSIELANLVCLYDYALATARLLEKQGKSKYTQVLSGVNLKADEIDWTRFKNFQGIVKLRQWADQHFMPYDFMWQRQYKIMLDLGFKRFYFNLLGKPDILDKVLQLWMAELRSRIVYAKSPVFGPDRYVSTHLQYEYYFWLCRALKAKYGPTAPGRIIQAAEDDRISSRFLTELISSGHKKEVSK